MVELPVPPIFISLVELKIFFIFNRNFRFWRKKSKTGHVPEFYNLDNCPKRKSLIRITNYILDPFTVCKESGTAGTLTKGDECSGSILCVHFLFHPCKNDNFIDDAVYTRVVAVK